MTRTVVPPPRAVASGPGGRLRGATGGDDLPTKLVKYIPGETLAFFVPAAALIGSDRDGLLVAIAIVGTIGNVGWLWYSARPEPATKRPRTHFYVLSVIAFVVWALVTAPNLADLISLDEVAAAVLLMAGVFLIPLADGILNALGGQSPALGRQPSDR
jgi:hypothetical protein